MTTTISSFFLRALSRGRRILYRAKVERVGAEILRCIDHAGFDREFKNDPEQQALAGLGSSKYIDLAPWIRENVDRYFRYGLHRTKPGARVLDLGCGSGFFLLVCRHFGLQPLGLDTDLDPLYTRQINFFGLERVEHRIVPGDYLPVFERRFDLVTAFMIGFNQFPGGATWDTETWLEFLDELGSTLETGGRALLWFNRYNDEYYPPDLPGAVARIDRYRARFFGNCLDLRPK
ncbi:MAG: class I SAM-dependent methyltransferase [Actinomycetota bacterium]|nr:class I SAM-dependent methyltransferase [Actinomycetota bacterium]